MNLQLAQSASPQFGAIYELSPQKVDILEDISISSSMDYVDSSIKTARMEGAIASITGDITVFGNNYQRVCIGKSYILTDKETPDMSDYYHNKDLGDDFGDRFQKIIENAKNENRLNVIS